MKRKNKIIISLCDESLEWSIRFAEYSGYSVIAVDPKHRDRWGQRSYAQRRGHGTVTYIGDTVAGFIERDLPKILQLCQHDYDTMRCKVVGVIGQPVCTQFSAAGARYWERKDREQPELLADAIALVADCQHVITSTQPDWWVLENPVGRMGRVCGYGKPVMTYQPHEYAHLADDPDGERYTKRTCLWGTFNADALRDAKGRMKPKVWGKSGNTSKMHALYGGASAHTKMMRSKTPEGFSWAFWMAHGERAELQERRAPHMVAKEAAAQAYDGPIPSSR